MADKYIYFFRSAERLKLFLQNSCPIASYIGKLRSFKQLEMKRVLLILLVAVLAVPSCHPRALPVITERKTDPIKPRVNDYPPIETVAPDTAAGKRIFMARCIRCHGLPEPSQYSSARWETILPVMIPRARLDNEQALHVRAYLLAGAAR